MDQQQHIKPVPLEVRPDHIPAFLKAQPRWVLWRYTWCDKSAKWTKVPTFVNRHGEGHNASSTDPRTWQTFGSVWRSYSKHESSFDGIGFVLAENDNTVGIDLDHCITADGTMAPWAADDITLMDTYTEKSPSGSGVRMFAVGPLPGGWRKRGDREVYSTGRFLTVTGHQVHGRGVEDRTTQITEFHTKYAPPREEKVKVAETGPVAGPDVELGQDDEAVLGKLRAAANSTKFSKLWRGDWHGSYPSQSEADSALCCLLAYYTRDPDQIDRLFEASGLFRAKWEREYYKHRTINSALDTVTAFDPDLELQVLEGRLAEKRLGERAVVTVEEVTEPDRPAEPKVMLINLSEFARRAKLRPQKWLIDGWLGAGQSHLFSGREKSGKSTLAFHTVACLLTGHDWFGRKVEATPVLYLDMENPAAYTLDNIESALAACGSTVDAVADRWHTPDPLPAGVTAEFARDCIAATGRAGGAVVIDSGRAAFGPLTQVPNWENSSSEVARFVRPLTRLAHESGWAVVVIHHNAKASDQFAGSGDWGGGVDHLWNYKVTSDHVRHLEFRGRRVGDEPDLEIVRKNGRLELDTSRREGKENKKLGEIAEERRFLAAVPVGEPNKVPTATISKITGLNKKDTLALGDRLVGGNKVRRGEGEKVTDGYQWWRDE